MLGALWIWFRGSRRRAALAVVAVASAVVPLGRATASTAPVAFRDGAGLHVLGVTRFDDRDYNVSVLSPDLGRPVNVRVLVPAGYTSDPGRRYPVLYLFHGTSGYASDWVVHGGAEQTTAPYGLITVMPDAGFDGDGGFWFTNWVDRTTSHGPSQYEDFLIDSLIPWVDHNLRTVATREGRAVAGLSQGGYGSAEMAARHPDLFVSMASFSGAPEIERDPEVFAGAVGVIEAIEVGDDRVPPFSELGNPAVDLVNWQGHDPATLDTNLRGMRIYLWTGMGLPGPYDSGPDAYGSLIEGAVYQSTQHFYEHLQTDGIPAYYDNYVYGTHTFAYWARDLRAYVPRMMQDFSHPSHPDTVSYTSIDRRWSQWGYTVSIDRTAVQEFSSLTEGGAAGYSLSGSGTATVTTPGYYAPGSLLQVTVSGPSSTTTQIVRVPPDGRVTTVVGLGGGSARVRISARR
ncbi:MAG TPA: alpha/beta hydrolase family protein [Acidimicrobiales bacterium]|nr:alpha/beta hydrolase family protein [Acidimicrobiales bacterium]